MPLVRFLGICPSLQLGPYSAVLLSLLVACLETLLWLQPWAATYSIAVVCITVVKHELVWSQIEIHP